MRILVFRIGQLGDTIAALPAMWAVKREFAGAHLTLLSDRHERKTYVLASDLLRGSGIFDEFLSYPASEVNGFKRAWQLAVLLTAIRRRRFDKLAYLAPSARTPSQIKRDQRFFRLAGINHFIGMRGFPHLPKKVAGKPLGPTARESALILARLEMDGIFAAKGLSVSDLCIGAVEEAALSGWRETLPSDGGRPWLAVAPGSKMPSKRWPPERFAKVVTELIEEFDIWPVVFGGKEDRGIGDELVNGWKAGYNAAGALELRPAMAALKHCVLFLGNDTGTMHMAALAGVPCVAIFSARDCPGLWYPNGEGHRVFRAQIDCEGCGLVECVERKNECLHRISAAEVLAGCKSTIQHQVAAKNLGAPLC
jgi:hypothetical protein